jgi:hypothetical protein
MRDQGAFMGIKLANDTVTLTIESCFALENHPETVVTGVRMEVVSSALSDYLNISTNDL